MIGSIGSPLAQGIGAASQAAHTAAKALYDKLNAIFRYLDTSQQAMRTVASDMVSSNKQAMATDLQNLSAALYQANNPKG